MKVIEYLNNPSLDIENLSVVFWWHKDKTLAGISFHKNEGYFFEFKKIILNEKEIFSSHSAKEIPITALDAPVISYQFKNSFEQEEIYDE